MTATAVATQPTPTASLVTKFAERFGVEPSKMVATLKATAFKSGGPDGVSNEQMMALLIVADQYGLNPWTKEIYAFPDKNNGIVPVVGVDGWIRIINAHPAFKGYEFEYGPADEKRKGAPSWTQCTITRGDREKPIVIREYLAECYRETGPWQSHPARMLRHKALIQCGRVAFGFGGIYDEDEARTIVELNPSNGATPAAVADLNAAIAKKSAAKAGATDAEEVFTYAQVREALEKAKDGDTFNAAVDLIRYVTDETQQGELRKFAEEKRATLAQ